MTPPLRRVCLVEGGGSSNPLQQKYEEYRSALKNNAGDFQTWTYLLGTVERLDSMDKITEVFNEFLTEYPLCYGYWKKYADAALKHYGVEASTEIYERGLGAIPYSVDLWSHYVTFRMTKSNDTPDMIRSLFERGLAFVGTDFLCHILLDKYFQFEAEQKNDYSTAQLFGRVLSIPCKELDAYHGKFEKFAEEHIIQEMLDRSEIDAYKRQVAKKKTQGELDAAGMDTHDQAPDADVQMQENSTPKGHQELGDDAMDMDVLDAVTDDEVKQFWIESMAKLHATTKEALSIRRQYEDCIKRPYFHVKPLDNVQLQAWWKYLDYLCSQGEHRDIVILYERCLVACASYPEFWMRYALYMESIDANEAINILKRAVQVFCKHKSEMQLFAAHFFERQGDVQSSRECLQHVTSTLAPSLLTAIVQHTAFEYRHGCAEAANQLYESKIQAELQKEDSEIVVFLAIQYAHVQVKKLGSKQRAREIVHEVLEARPEVLKIWEGAIQIEELIQDDESVRRSIELYRRCTTTPQESEDKKALSEEDRCMMSERLLNYVDLHGTPEEYGSLHRWHLEQYGLSRIAPSLNQKRTDATQAETAAATTTQTESAAATGADAKSATPVTSTAMAEYLAQYYQYAAAAAAAGYNAYGGYSAPYSG